MNTRANMYTRTRYSLVLTNQVLALGQDETLLTPRFSPPISIALSSASTKARRINSVSNIGNVQYLTGGSRTLCFCASALFTYDALRGLVKLQDFSSRCFRRSGTRNSNLSRSVWDLLWRVQTTSSSACLRHQFAAVNLPRALFWRLISARGETLIPEDNQQSQNIQWLWYRNGMRMWTKILGVILEEYF